MSNRIIGLLFVGFILFGFQLQAEPRVIHQEDFNATEKEQLWHLSEGADVMPLRWFLNVRSATSTKKGTFLFEDMEEKFGVVELDKASYGPGYTGDAQWASPMKWLGITLAWSEPSPSFVKTNDESIPYTQKPSSDSEAEALLRAIDKKGAQDLSGSLFGGQAEIPMVGTNCTLCHSSRMEFGGKNVFVEGAPNMFHARNFFRDMTASTVATMVKPDLLKAYLKNLENEGLINSLPEEAREEQIDSFVEGFKEAIIGSKATQIGKGILHGIGEIFDGDCDICDLDIGNDTSKSVLQEELGKVENRPVVAEWLARFLVLSYPNLTLDKVKATPALWNRMQWLAMILNVDPDLAATTEGYGRTDAFGRISNAIARGSHALPLVAPVSFPPMWGMEYTSLFHYNGNTNSVIMRNAGQSFGLGALLLDDQFTATTNIYNLNRIEKLIYKIKVPEWNAMVPEEHRLVKEDDIQEVMQGCDVYLKNCYECHDSQGQRVGLNKRLIKHKVFALDALGTDPNHAVIQGTPTLGDDGTVTPFRQALFTLTKKVKERYIDLLAPQNPELAGGQREATLNSWGNFETRGMEHFRDPYLGEDFSDAWLKELFALGKGVMDQARFNAVTAELEYMRLVDEAGRPQKHTHGYIAKDLAGIWASAPYLHNGSVPTLWHLISEQKTRPSKFVVGCREYDPNFMGLIWNSSQAVEAGCLVTADHWFDSREGFNADMVINGVEGDYSRSKKTYTFDDHLGAKAVFTNGNSTGGHNFTIKTASDKKALIKFLKVLRPPEEYSWKSESWYKIEPKVDAVQAQFMKDHNVPFQAKHLKCTQL